MNRNVIIGVALLLTLVGGVLFHYIKTNYEWTEVEISQGMSTEARTSRLLAARRYLDKLNVYREEIESNEFYYNLPDETSTILLWQLQGNLSDGAYSNLLEWVNSGGHLIFGLPKLRRDRFVDQTLEFENDSGVGNFLNSLSISPDFTFDNHVYAESDDAPVLLNVHGAGSNLTVSSDKLTDDFILQGNVEPTVWVEDQGSYVFAQFSHGSGTVSALSTPTIWANRNIGDSDNALLLAHAIDANKNDYATIFIADKRTELLGIFRLIIHNFPWFCLVIVALGLALLRIYSVRFGPVLSEVQLQTTNFSRYLFSKSQFLEQTQSTANLLASLRARTRISFNGSSDCSEQELLKQMSFSSNLPKEKIYSALFDDNSRNSTSLIIIIKTLQKLSRTRIKRAKQL